MRHRLLSHGLGLVGGLIGGILGYYIVSWLTKQNFYGMMLPGAMIGLGSSLLSPHRSRVRGAICALAALVLGLYCEWRLFPFIADGSLRYFVAHIPELRGLTLIMIGLGSFFGFWFGKDASPLFAAPRESRAEKENGPPKTD